ncbi:Biopolymer transport protein ExbD/TolR family [Pseudomonas syringae pv. atrofaciens]|nr:Biopolymer transport protein ExbD/TolR family [Pseudomonas syringae pv. atrofaciens]
MHRPAYPDYVSIREISADGKTPHQSVITAMDAAGKLGFSHLRMTTVEATPAN